MQDRESVPLVRGPWRVAAMTVFGVMFAAALPAQLQFAELGRRHLPADVDFTAAIAWGDVDGDGDADLVVGNYLAQNRLYLNDGGGTFSDATAARMPSDSDRTATLALGDVDGDGDPDLIVGNSLQRNRLYLNDGRGTFRDATAPRLPLDLDNTAALALADVDRDGDVDVIVGNLQHRNRLYLSFPLPGLLIPQPAGVASLSLAVPNLVGVAGLRVYGQALLLQPPGQPWLTNVVADVLAR